MPIIKPTGLLIFTLSLFIPHAGAELTPLVDVEGREINVELVSLDDDKVTIIFNDDKVDVPMARLDEASQERVRTVIETREKERQERLADAMKLPDGTDIVPGKLQFFTVEATDKDRDWSKCPELQTIKVSVAFPEGFDPEKKWPVFFCNDTGPGRNAAVARTYQKAANRLGYVVIGAQGEGAPGADRKSLKELGYWSARGSATVRAINELAERWPLIMESDWSYGGFSGGAKNCCFLAVYLYEVYKETNERVPTGFYLGGCNEAKMDAAVENYSSRKSAFKDAVFFISNGDQDKVASPQDGARVEDLMNRNGFRETKREVYQGGHKFYEPHFTEALEWFKQVAAER